MNRSNQAASQPKSQVAQKSNLNSRDKHSKNENATLVLLKAIELALAMSKTFLMPLIKLLVRNMVLQKSNLYINIDGASALSRAQVVFKLLRKGSTNT